MEYNVGIITENRLWNWRNSCANRSNLRGAIVFGETRDRGEGFFGKKKQPLFRAQPKTRSKQCFPEKRGWLGRGKATIPRDGTFLITYTHAAASRDDYKSSGAPPSKVITAWILDNVAASTVHLSSIPYTPPSPPSLLPVPNTFHPASCGYCLEPVVNKSFPETLC